MSEKAESIITNFNLYLKRCEIMGIKFSFFAYGILAIAALTFVLSFTAVQVGQDDWAGSYFWVGTGIAFLFMLYMFLKLMKK